MRRHLSIVSAAMAVVTVLISFGAGVSRADVSGNLPAHIVPSLISLTDAELAWLREHPSIRVYNETDWPPFNFAEGGQPRGYSIDFANLIADRTGLRLDYVTGPPRDASIPMLKDGSLDLLLNIIRTSEREQDLLFTPPYVHIAPAILSRKDQRYDNLDQLAGKTVVIPNGFFYQEFVRRNFPKIRIAPAANTLAGIQAVARQEADAVLSASAVLSHLIDQEKIAGLVISSELNLLDPELALGRMATRKDNPILARILTKAIDSIGLEDRRALERKWLGDTPDVTAQWARTGLTDAERVWLEQHPRIRLGVNPNYPPFDFMNEKGVFAGISADYVEIIAKQLGITMTVVPGLSWTEAIEGTKEGRVDVVVGIKQTEERRQFLEFTPDYLTFPIVIITRKNHPMIAGLADLRGKTLALGQNYASTQEIERRYPEIKQLLFASMGETLTAVRRGEADAAVMNLGTASYLIAKHALTGLVVAAPAGLEDARSAFGVRKDWPELAWIMRKALASITPEEEAAVRAKWITAPADARLATEQAQRVAMQIAAVAAFVILAIVLWNYRLKRQVRERRRAEEIIVAKEAELRDMFEHSPVSVVITRLDGTFLYANPSWLNLLHMTQDELFARRAQDNYVDLADREKVLQLLKNNGTVRELEVRYKRSDGQPVWTLLSADLREYQQEQCLISWFIDITARKHAEETLSAAEEQLRTALDNMSDGLYMVDKDWNIQIINERYREYLGYPEGVMNPGQPLRDSMRYRAQRGDYGPGDADVLVDQRTAAIR